MKLKWAILQFLVFVKISVSLAPNELVILILAQPNDYNHQFGQNLRSNLYVQSVAIAKDHLINVHFLHEIFNHPGEWTFLAALPYIKSNIIKPHTKWIILCEEQSSVDLFILLENLSKEDYTKTIYLGSPIYDQDATIIHHFAFFENPQWFPYPLLRSGIAFTVSLIERMSERVRKANKMPRTEFSIDASHELALFILENIPNENSANWQKLPQPMSKQKPNMYQQQYHYQRQKNQNQDHKQKNSKKLDENNRNLGDKNNDGDNNEYNKVDFLHDDRDIDTYTNDYEIVEQKNGIDKKYDDSLHNNLIDIKSTTESNETIVSASNSRLSNNWSKLILTNASYFCAYNESTSKYRKCAIRPLLNMNLSCNSTSRESIYFAIKTCNKFVKDRVPTIERTWGRYVIHKRYFSDIADKDVSSISTGIPNTDTGHCSKTLSILKYALNDIEKLNRKIGNLQSIKWIFLSDDDTILSVAGVCEILGCFNPSTEDVYLGERYGYRMYSTDGFNYITGGGGIAFSLSTVKKILQYCSCPTMSSPDDMILGSCLHRLGVKAIHSSRFHQARSLDYANELLKLEKPISFHKFWQLDPLYEYDKWFRTDDEMLLLHEKKFQRNVVKNDRENFQSSVLSHEKLDTNINHKLQIPDVTNMAKPKHLEL